jgi:hypothetical protein
MLVQLVRESQPPLLVRHCTGSKTNKVSVNLVIAKTHSVHTHTTGIHSRPTKQWETGNKAHLVDVLAAGLACAGVAAE